MKNGDLIGPIASGVGVAAIAVAIAVYSSVWVSSEAGGLVTAVAFIALYFAPTVAVLARRGKHVAGVVLLDLFLGWTFVGWVAALVWAVSMEVKSKIKEES